MVEVRGLENLYYTFFFYTFPCSEHGLSMRGSAISELIQSKNGLIHSNEMRVTSHFYHTYILI